MIEEDIIGYLQETLSSNVTLEKRCCLQDKKLRCVSIFNKKLKGYHIGIPQLEDTGTKLCQCFSKLIIDSKTSRVWTNLLLDMKSFPLPRLDKVSRSKFSCSSTSTETDDDIEDCDEDSQFM